MASFEGQHGRQKLMQPLVPAEDREAEELSLRHPCKAWQGPVLGLTSAPSHLQGGLLTLGSCMQWQV